MSGAPDRARPTVTAENRRSGYAALSASSRTHAPTRCRALTREYVTLPSTSPRTPGTVPLSGRPSGSTTRTSTDSGAASPPSARRAWPAISSTTGRMRSITGSASRPGGSVPRAISAAMQASSAAPLSTPSSSRSPDAPALEAVELHGQRIGDVLAEVAERDAEPLPQERPHRVLGEADEVVERHDRRAGRRERLGEERRDLVAIADERPGTVERDGVEAPRLLARERTGREVPRIEGLERMAHDHALVRRAVGRPHGRVDDVEELADRDGGRPGDVRALVVARVRDDQPVRRRQQRVEQQLPVLGARIAVADVRVAEHEVVAVAG